MLIVRASMSHESTTSVYTRAWCYLYYTPAKNLYGWCLKVDTNLAQGILQEVPFDEAVYSQYGRKGTI
jgi:hypothetical protein